MIQNGKSIKVGFTIKATEACPNLDYNYGLYHSREEAFEALGEDGEDVITLGRTVGIMTENGVVEYWWKNGVSLEDLVPKCESAELPVIMTMLQDIEAAVDDINARMTAQEEAQESDEWDEL